jgi:hypothetical protein
MMVSFQRPLMGFFAVGVVAFNATGAGAEPPVSSIVVPPVMPPGQRAMIFEAAKNIVKVGLSNGLFCSGTVLREEQNSDPSQQKGDSDYIVLSAAHCGVQPGAAIISLTGNEVKVTRVLQATEGDSVLLCLDARLGVPGIPVVTPEEASQVARNAAVLLGFPASNIFKPTIMGGVETPNTNQAELFGVQAYHRIVPSDASSISDEPNAKSIVLREFSSPPTQVFIGGMSGGSFVTRDDNRSLKIVGLPSRAQDTKHIQMGESSALFYMNRVNTDTPFDTGEGEYTLGQILALTKAGTGPCH